MKYVVWVILKLILLWFHNKCEEAYCFEHIQSILTNVQYCVACTIQLIDSDFMDLVVKEKTTYA